MVEFSMETQAWSIWKGFRTFHYHKVQNLLLPWKWNLMHLDSAFRFAEKEYFKTCVIRGWMLSCTAYNSDNGYVCQEFGKSTICIAFSGSLDSSALPPQTDHKFGACNINERKDCFASLELALVSKEALAKFSHVWNDNLKAQVEEARGMGKVVLFTGHNIGGGIATLATLASLEKWGKGAPVYAITFGFPLIGDEVFAREVRKQGWDNKLFNVVSSGDVFARNLLAPCESVRSHLEFLLSHWQKSMEQMNGDNSDIFMAHAEWGFPEYLSTVMQHAWEVINLINLTNMEAAKSLVAELAVELSPYRPFGHYLFCSSKGALFVENNEAQVALPILYNSLASAQNEASISDHINYGRVIHEKTNIINLEMHPILPPSRGAPFSARELLLDILGSGYARLFHANTNSVNLERRSAATGVQLAAPGLRIQENTFRFEDSMINNQNLSNQTMRCFEIRKRSNPIEETEQSKKLKGKMIEEDA